MFHYSFVFQISLHIGNGSKYDFMKNVNIKFYFTDDSDCKPNIKKIIYYISNV